MITKRLLKNEHGFTLIELLVVIIIISILSTVGFTMYTKAQEAARDATRKQDIDHLAEAITLFYTTKKYLPLQTDNIDHFICSNTPNANWTPNAGYYDTWRSELNHSLAPSYLKVLNIDPKDLGSIASADDARCNGHACVYCYSTNITCGPGNASCPGGPAVWTNLENCNSDKDTGEASVMGYSCSSTYSIYLRSIEKI